ncbi:DMT family transporter [Candidatus Gottesmanbacteria bacterium]|nr:DMT family transporter [Candidatus Gottesmanbacteria bacterium]
MNKYTSIVQAVLAFALWSTLGIFFNRVALPASTYVVFGSLVGLCALYLWFYWRKGGIPKLRFSWALLGLLVIAGFKGVIWFKTLSMVPVAKAMLIHNLAPVFALLFAPILIKERPGMNHLIAVATGFLGLAILLKLDTVGSSIWSTGMMFALAAAVSSGLQDVIQRKLAKTIPGSSQAFIFILGQALGSVFFLIPQFPATVGWVDFSQIVYFGLIGTAIPIILLSSSFRGLKSFEVSTLGFTEPALGALWGAIFLNQPILPSTAIGGLLIFLSGLTAVKNEKNN